MIRLVTGWEDFDLAELMQVGERRLNMLRIFNAREGLTATMTACRKGFSKRSKARGPRRVLRSVRPNTNRPRICTTTGWDVETGNPTLAHLTKLGLEWAAQLVTG